MDVFVLYLGAPGTWTIAGVFDKEEVAIEKAYEIVRNHGQGNVNPSHRKSLISAVIDISFGNGVYLQINETPVWTIEVTKRTLNQLNLNDW